ncbi:MAG TPA: acyl-CoA dehydrogenase family protein [Deltaproteobacteria bacterium]|nr:acyl-CoA dehydrogenase family protein [Deltaproteobacteria bacterium]HPJ92671.1 acyl-CoA dehydrogenase family protein [Deltaproteobacteria bacterium]HPR55193.1 acyl-CoA dehydrogenase family protein [Deltaproteobacteria bacterium]
MLTLLKNELKPFAELAQSFAAKELSKKTEEHDRYPFGELFTDVVDKARDVGLLAVTLPEELGGIGGGMDTLCVILREISRVDASLAGVIFTSAVAQEIMLAAGARKQASRIFSTTSSSGDFLVAFPCYADPASEDYLPETVRSGRGYALTGSIELLSLGGLAKRAIVPARTGRDESFSFFLMDLNQETISLSGPVFTLGLHACPCADMVMKGAKAILIGEEGKGRTYFQGVSAPMHVAAAAISSGIMRGSFNDAMAYARERFQGGREIVNWSEVGMILANMKIKVDVAELLVAQACQAMGQGPPGRNSPCLSAALHVHDLAGDLTTDGIQVLGGNGYMKDYGQEKRFRDAHQVASFLGASPMKKIRMIRETAGLGERG